MKLNLILITAGVSLLGVGAHAATIVDLTAVGSSGTANGALFQQINPQTTGTGVIDPFLRIDGQHGTEDGFNNNVNAFTLDDVAKGGQNYNHDIQLSTVPVVNVGGVNYYQFLLDINQTKESPLLSLDILQIYLKGSPITTFAGSSGVLSDLTGSGAALKYNLDGAGDAYVKLNYSLNPGSGAGDMFANIPVSALGTDGSQYVYLYSLFGSNNGANDGFEEWSTLKASSSVPDGGTTLLMLGAAISGLGLIRRKLS